LFFHNKGRRGKRAPTPDRYLALAALLASEIGRRGALQRPPSKAEWAAHLYKLESLDGVPAALIEETVRWYAANMGKDYVPTALSGRGFRKKWDQILAAVERSREAPTASDVSPAAKLLAERHAHLVWPAGSGDGVPGYLTHVLSAYAAWRAKVQKVKDDHRTEYRLRSDQSYVMLPPGDDRRLLAAAEQALSGLKDPGGFAADLLREEHRLALHFGRWNPAKRVRKWREELDRLGFNIMARYGDPVLWRVLTKGVDRGTRTG
jgi:hypothetical protein